MEKQNVEFIVNGRHYELLIAPQTTLLELLRDELGLTGTKYSCGVAECGSCTVLIDGEPVLACCTLAMTVRNRSILTIEGLSEGTRLHPLQQAFIVNGATQCGFCTPGMILTAKALLDRNPNPTRQDVKEALAGNLCRCTGYVKIIDAVLATAEELQKQG